LLYNNITYTDNRTTIIYFINRVCQLIFNLCHLRIKSGLFFDDLRIKSGLPKNGKKDVI